MTSLQSLLARFRKSANSRSRKQRSRLDQSGAVSVENLEDRLLLVNPVTLSSNSDDAPVTVYLDFDGHTESDVDWVAQRSNGTGPIDTPAFDLDNSPATFSDEEISRIEEIYFRVAEDFAPFDINITTVEPPIFRQGRELLVSIGGDGSWTDDERFISLFDSHNTGRSQTAFVFPLDSVGLGGAFPQNVAANVSQSIAGAMGLSLHTNISGDLVEGDVDVAPILGDQIVGDDNNTASNNSIRDLWIDGPINSGSSTQDDLAALDAALNVAYREDDHGNTDLASTGIAIGPGSEVVTGIIETNDDRDVFSFSTADTVATISITGLDLRPQFDTADTPGSNLDPLITLRDASGQIVAIADGPDLTASMTEFLTEGSYFLEVSNKGEYGNLGEYTVTIDGVDTLPPFANPVPLNSNPGAPIDFYLSFAGGILPDTHPLLNNRVDGGTGQVTLSAYDSDGDSSVFSVAEIDEITEIYERVAEDFRPFDVNVTTVAPDQLSDGTALGVIVGDTNAFDPLIGYLGLLGTFSDNLQPNTGVTLPANIQSGTPDDAKSIAFQISATLATMLGLGSHPEYATDGTVQNQFDPGNSVVGPILGAPFTSLRDVWVNAAGNQSDAIFQDDLALITADNNGISFRPDDFANNIATASAIDVGVGDEQITGIIETNDDRDFFQVDTLATTTTISVTGLDLASRFGVPNPGSNLDPVLRLYNSSGFLLSESDIAFSVANPNLSLTASLTESVPAGRYFIEVSNRGEYGNLGQYTLNIEGIDAVPVTISVDPSTFTETDGIQPGVGTVSRPAGSSLNGSILVDLESSDLTELTVPSQVIIPSGLSSANFDVTIQDDPDGARLDGNQRVSVRAIVGGVINSETFVTVNDAETIELTLTPDPVAESSGTASLTLRRSNLDVNAPNHWVTNGSELLEYSPAGVLEQTITVPWPTGGIRPPGQTVHDVTVLEDGRIVVFNGTENAALSIYNPEQQTWAHIGPINGLSGLTTDEGIGGIAASGDYVFLSDFESLPGDERGMVRINLITGEIDRFADGTLGSRLFALASGFGSDVIEINPNTGETVNRFTLPLIPGQIARYRGETLAFDGEHLWIRTFTGSSGFHPLIKVDPNTGAVLEEHSLGARQAFFYHEGVAHLDGRLYLKELFDGGTEAYDPEARRFIPGIVDYGAVHGVNYNDYISSLPGESRLVFSAGTSTIYEIDLQTGGVASNFAAAETFRSNPGLSTISDVTFGGTVYNDLIYVAGASNEIDVYTRTGQQVDTDPSTAAVDSLTTEDFFTGDIAGADVPGVSSLDLSFRDVTIGFDGLVYGLTDDGTQVSVHDPETLIRLQGIDLDQAVTTIAVSDDSGIYAGSGTGDLILFDFLGATVNSVSTSLVSVVDIEVNIGQEVIVSDAGGTVLLTNQTAILNGDTAQTRILESTGTTGFVSFGRHPTRTTGDLVVTLSSDDVSELQVPSEITIPEGQQEITIDVNIIDDDERDGDQTVNISAQSPEYAPAAITVIVEDVETVSVSVLPTSVSEAAGELPDAIIVQRSDVDGPFEFVTGLTETVEGPISILDDNVIVSQITVPSQVSRITDVEVTISIEHEAIPDLDVYLISPSGTRVELFTDLSTNESSLQDTVFDDEAAISIVDGDSPYTGRFRPEVPLSVLDGENPSGTWSLEVIDDNTTDIGELLNWSLKIDTIGLAPLAVTLSSTDESEAVVQTTLTIPGNQSEVRIPLTAIDDNELDGTQTAQILVNSAPIDDGHGEFLLVGDSVDVTDAETIAITISNRELSEDANNPATTATITRSDVSTSTQLIVNLSSSDLTELSVPSTVTIPAGQTSATFDISVIDDRLFDGDQLVTISASATGFITSESDPITVMDKEPRLVLSTVTPTVPEDGGMLTFTLARQDANDLSVPQEVTLSSSDTTEIFLPQTTVTIPAGEFSTSFTANIIDDNLLDGDQTVIITAVDSDTANKVVNDDSFTVTVTDAEYISLAVTSGSATFSENGGDNVAEVTVSLTAADHILPVFVLLNNSDVTELSVPDRVIIPAGSSSATFTVHAVDDVIIDSSQLVRLTATLEDYIDGTLDLTVTDYEPPILTGPTVVTEDPTPSIAWAPLTGAVRYDLWVNDISRNITQLFRHENLAGGISILEENFESQTFDPNVWEAVTSVEINNLAQNDPSGNVSAHFNGNGEVEGGANGVDSLDSATIDLAGRAGVQLTYSFQKSTSLAPPMEGEEEDPNRVVSGQDLVISYRDTDGFWNQLSRQSSSQADFNHFETVRLDLPPEALHSEFALRIESFGPSEPEAGDDPVDRTSWFVDYVEITEHQSFTPEQELGVGRYRAWVRGFDSLNRPTAWSRGMDFRIVTRPEFVTPLNQSFVSTRDFPEVSWTSVVDTDYYDLWVNNITTGESQVIRETRLPTTSYPTELAGLEGGAYRAWTRASVVDVPQTETLRAEALIADPNLTPAELAEIEHLVYGRWSAPVNFTVLATPTVLTPGGATFIRRPEITWTPVEGASNYYVWLARRTPGEAPEVVLRDRFVTDTTRAPDVDLIDGTYVVWVQAISADGTPSRWSEAQTFTINGNVTVLSPQNSDIVSATPTFQWTAITGTERYEVWVNRLDVPEHQSVYSDDVRGTSFTVSTPLVSGGTYRLWVRAVSEMGEFSFWSFPVTFSVAAVDAPVDPGNVPAVFTEEAAVASLSDRTIVASASRTAASEASSLVVQELSDAEITTETSVQDADSSVESVEIDSVMEEFAVADWSLEANTSQEDENGFAAAGVALGLVASSSLITRKRGGKKQN